MYIYKTYDIIFKLNDPKKLLIIVRHIKCSLIQNIYSKTF